jgi:hypothetical protein
MRVTINRVKFRSLDEEFVHLGNAADLVRGTIYSKHEDKDDSKQDCGVRAIGPDENRKRRLQRRLTSRRGGSRAYHQRRRRY